MLISLQSAGSNITMPYAEIGASLSTIAVLVYCCGGGLFLLLWIWVWLYSNIVSRWWLIFINYHTTTISYVLNYHQLNQNYVYSNYKMRKISFLDIFSTTIINYTWKVIRLTRVIYNHELQSFQDRISSCALRYVDIY